MLEIREVEDQLIELIDNIEVPAMAVSIFNETDILYEKTLGYTNWEEKGEAITPDTVFRIGSVSKTLTATLIMSLVEKGKLDLDFPIYKYVDTFKLQNEAYAKTVTLRMLLSHTAGLPNGGDIEGPRDQSGWEGYINETVPNLDLVNPPGALYSYSNHNFNIAGYVAQHVCGKLFAELVKEYVLEPLGITEPCMIH
jgi:CubicO group peptidase (beta-lactamase class C family)